MGAGGNSTKPPLTAPPAIGPISRESQEMGMFGDRRPEILRLSRVGPREPGIRHLPRAIRMIGVRKAPGRGGRMHVRRRLGLLALCASGVLAVAPAAAAATTTAAPSA